MTAGVTKSIRQKIEEKIGDPVSDLRHFASGQNTEIYLVDLSDHRRMIAKTMPVKTHQPDMIDLEPEGWMLDYLARKTRLPVPAVHWYDPSIILMDYIEDHGIMNDPAQEHAADLLAVLHKNRNAQFGFDRDTTTGPFHQPNPCESDWITFFCDHRLVYMGRAALSEGMIDSGLMSKIETLASNLDRLITRHAKPSLIHGDVLGGNILMGKDRIQAFLDPAVYYADPEMELAQIRLFDTFGEAFFKRYHEQHPIDPAFEEGRWEVYALYPLLVHARMYGGAYSEALRASVERFTG